MPTCSMPDYKGQKQKQKRARKESYRRARGGIAHYLGTPFVVLTPPPLDPHFPIIFLPFPKSMDRVAREQWRAINGRFSYMYKSSQGMRRLVLVGASLVDQSALCAGYVVELARDGPLAGTKPKRQRSRPLPDLLVPTSPHLSSFFFSSSPTSDPTALNLWPRSSV